MSKNPKILKNQTEKNSNNYFMLEKEGDVFKPFYKEWKEIIIV